jgi:hypothetical protein
MTDDGADPSAHGDADQRAHHAERRGQNHCRERSVHTRYNSKTGAGRNRPISWGGRRRGW